MKRSGILNPAICHLLASSGHTDYFTICDSGFPVPQGPERIDLTLVAGQPTVLDVLKAVQAEFSIDRVVIAEEMEQVSPGLVKQLQDLLGAIPLETLSHLQLKRLATEGRATIRTGDTTPYANVLVVSG
ncbi:MAG TPA: D-ribose pyranase [Thermomicrobiales bacterium]|nr:D-ribose pyranase [Thermomicrobiales bacterium]